MRAIGLMSEWRRATAAHLAIAGGMSCACGSAFDGVPVVDLEHDLVAYAYEKHAGALGAVFERAGCHDGQWCDLASLLRAAAQSPDVEPGAMTRMLDDLAVAIQSLGGAR